MAEVGGLDWGAPVAKKDEDDDELQLEWSDEGDDEEEEEAAGLVHDEAEEAEVEAVPSGPVKTDIMSQQLKFMACLKVSSTSSVLINLLSPPNSPNVS